MRVAEMAIYVKGAFENWWVIAISAIGAFLYKFFFPEIYYLEGTVSMIVMMCTDLITRLYANKCIAGGWSKAFKSRKINSHALARGTSNKVLVFFVMMIISACAYRISPIAEGAKVVTVFIFIVLFFTEAISILENLSDAGVSNITIFKKFFKKKLQKVVCEELEKSDVQKEETEI